MGWIIFNEDRSAKEYFIDKYNNEENYELVDIAIKNFRTAYIAVKDLKKGYTFAMVYLLHRAPKSYDNFGYKDMSEFAGPGETECPKRIIDKLTPIEEIIKIQGLDPEEDMYSWAQNWRDASLKNATNAKRIAKGDVIKMIEPIEFSSGAYFQYFKKVNRKWVAIARYNTQDEREYKVKLRGFKNMKYEFV